MVGVDADFNVRLPASTCVAVQRLLDARSRVEVQVVAVVSETCAQRAIAA